MKRKEHRIPDDVKNVVSDLRKETDIKGSDSELLEDCFALAYMADQWLGRHKQTLPEQMAGFLISISSAYLVGKGALVPVGETREVQAWKSSSVAGVICFIVESGAEQFPNLNPRLDALMRYLNETS